MDLHPTLVVYALATPMTVSNFLGAKPRPLHTPPNAGLEEVTKGYVPKSRSSIVAFAPSTNLLAAIVRVVHVFQRIRDEWLDACGNILVSLNLSLDVVLEPVKSRRRVRREREAQSQTFLHYECHPNEYRYASPSTRTRTDPLFVVPILLPLNSASRKPSISL